MKTFVVRLKNRVSKFVRVFHAPKDYEGAPRTLEVKQETARAQGNTGGAGGV